jgi:PAS domain S-box-containing protein
LAITDGADRQNSFRLIVNDIEELKKKEDKLRASERLLRITLDATSDGVFDRNLCTGKIYYGENWAMILGYTQEEVQRQHIKWKDLLHPDDRGQALAAVQEHITGHSKSYHAQFRMRQKNGLWKWIQARGKVVEWDDTGRPLRFVGTHTDITRQKQMEEELRKNEQRFRTLTELSPAGIYLTAPNGDCIYVNKCWSEMAGLSQTEAEGEGWLRAIHPDDQERVFAAWREMIESGGSFVLEYRLLAVQTGKTTWVYGLAQAFPDSDGECGGYLGINTDISVKKEAEIELQTTLDKLENLVKARTVDLERAYEDLLAEVNVRIRTEHELRKSEARLAQEKAALEEVNTALRVLLQRGTEDKSKLEEQMVANVNQLVLPHIDDMAKDPLTKRQRATLDLVGSNLAKLTSPFLRKISHFSLRLSPMEIKVSHFVKEGKSSKEIAEILGLSKDTIDIHRKNIRKKCGINGKSQNLRTMLMSFDNQ